MPAGLRPSSARLSVGGAVTLTSTWRRGPPSTPRSPGSPNCGLAALDSRIEADLQLGLHRDLIGELEALTAEFPLRESFRAHHMLALYRSGRQGEALRAYGRTRTVLAEELGIDPSPDLRDLEEAILTQDSKLDVRIKARIEERAVLAAELDDSIRHLSHRERDRALENRDEAVTAAVAASDGTILGFRGAAVYAGFARVTDAVGAARRLAGGALRLAVDHGELEVADETWTGPAISRSLRLAAVAHPGQTLLSADAHQRLTDEQAPGWAALSLGAVDIRGFEAPTQVFQLTGPGLSAEFPPLTVDRLPPPMPDGQVTGALPGYELRAELGGGPAGGVYRAYQASVGREVAVRVIRPEIVSDPRFIRRFEVVAQQIGAVAHPHLVPLLDYFRDPSQAFLVYRLIRGEPLGGGEPFGGDRALRIIEQIGDALAASHEAGVLHGRVRPASVLVDGDGNAFLSGTGVLGMLHDLVAFSADACTAPEVIGGDATVAGDVYGLGVLAAELLTGESVPPDGEIPRVGDRADQVIRRATAPDPDARHPSVKAFLAELLGRPEPDGTVRNPYKGLSAFQEADAGDFFGRRGLVEALVQSMSERRLTLVVGPSGIGKSSVVRAGLVPGLRTGALEGSASWLIVDMVPGSRPFEALERALMRVASRPVWDYVARMRDGVLGLGDVAADILPGGDEMVLIVDQFEELFTQVTDSDTRRRFLDLLADVESDAPGRVRVVATIRADFFDRPLRHARFGELLDRAVVTVPAPTREELADIVTGPARGVGLEVEESLVGALIADSDGESGGLPLLQYALTELFENRQDNRLTLSGYEQMGGLAGSIGRRADAIHAELEAEDQATAREVFVRLVTVEENTEDTRRRVRRSELMSIGAAAASVDRVLDAFGHHRLFVFDRDAATRGPTVEVAHEALIRHWPRLREWIDERREDLLVQRRLEVATRDWLAAGRDPSYLVGGGRLEQAEAFRDDSVLAVSDDQIQFLGESRRVVDADRARRRRIRRRVTTALSGALALAVALGSFGWVQRGVAVEETIRARMQDLATQAQVAIDEDPDLAINLALEAYDLSLQLPDERTPGEVMTALQTTTQASRLLARLPEGGYAAAVSPDGDRLVVAGGPEWSHLLVYDGESLAELTRRELAGPIGAIAFSPTGDRLAVSYSDPYGFALALPKEVGAVLDAKTLEVIDLLEGPCRADVIAFAVDGAYMLAGGRDISVDIDNACTTAWESGHPKEPRLSLTGRFSGQTNDGEVALRNGVDGLAVLDFVDIRTGGVESRMDLGKRVAAINPIAVHPNSRRLVVTIQAENRVEFWEPDAAEPSVRIESAGGWPSVPSPDGLSVALFGNDANLKVVSADTLGTTVLPGNAGGVWNAVFWPDGSKLVALTLTGEALVWELAGGGVRALENWPTSGTIHSMTLRNDGTAAVVQGEGDLVRPRVITIDDLAILEEGPGFISETWSSPVVAARADIIGGPGQPGVVASYEGEIIAELDRCSRPSAIDTDGEWAVISIRGIDGCAASGSLLNLRTGVTARTWDLWIPTAAFVGDGSEAVVAINEALASIVLQRVPPYENELGRLDLGNEIAPFVPNFSSDGRWLAFGSQTGGGYVIDADAVGEGIPMAEAVVLNPIVEGGPTVYTTAEGPWAVTVHTGNNFRVWDIQSGEQWFAVPMGYDGLGVAALTPDARYLYYTGEGGVVRRMPLDPEELVALARSRVQRDFNVEECERFLDWVDCSAYAEVENPG